MLNQSVVDRIKVWRNDPEAFVTDCIKVTPTAQQREGFRALTSMIKNKRKRLSIRSGHGTGKDAWVSWVALWFLVTRKYPKIICTAPTARQVYDVLWSEIHKWLRQSSLRDEIVYNKEQIYLKEAEGREWWIRHRTANIKASKEEQGETLQGLHEDSLLIICDEASGIPDPVFKPLEGALTRDDNYCIMIGNPTRSSGYFFDSHRNEVDKAQWVRLHWDSEKSEIVDESWITYMRTKYGVDSSVYQIRVKGEFPTEETGVLISYENAIKCVGNDVGDQSHEPLYLGVDVARMGNNKSVILPRQGMNILPWTTMRGVRTTELANAVNAHSIELEANGIVIDETGVGGGVVDQVLKHKAYDHSCVVHGVNAALASTEPKRFFRIRDELWWKTKERVDKRQYNFPEGDLGRELASELSLLRYDYDASTQALKVESKRDLRARLPEAVIDLDTADALVLTEYVYDISTIMFPGKSNREKKRYNPHAARNRSGSNRGWMVKV